jgi:hypothetical protein
MTCFLVVHASASTYLKSFLIHGLNLAEKGMQFLTRSIMPMHIAKLNHAILVRGVAWLTRIPVYVVHIRTISPCPDTLNIYGRT